MWYSANMSKSKLVVVITAAVVIVGWFGWWAYKTEVLIQNVTDFLTCEQAGYPIMESYPRQCRTSDGENFIELVAVGIPDLTSVQENIVVDGLKPGTRVFDSFVVFGKARGNWFFEASFPIKLLDENGTVLAQAVAQAQGDWMTTEFVPFSAPLTFSAPIGSALILVLQKDNPSGLPEHDAELRIPLIVSRPLYK